MAIRSVRVRSGTLSVYDSTTPGHPVLLVHGRRANRMWWHRVVPMLEPEFRVVAIDLAGHGDSPWRPTYSLTGFAQDLADLPGALGLPTVPTLVGHSMGGRIACVAAARWPSSFANLVVLDSWLPLDGERPAESSRERRRYFTSREEALARFRLIPGQPEPPARELRAVAEYSIGSSSGGYRWKVDPRARPHPRDAWVWRCLSTLSIPMTFCYGGLSARDGQPTSNQLKAIVEDLRVRCIEGGYHHLPLDSPEQTADVIRHAARQGRQRAGALPARPAAGGHR